MTGVDPAATFRDNYRAQVEAMNAVRAYADTASIRALARKMTARLGRFRSKRDGCLQRERDHNRAPVGKIHGQRVLREYDVPDAISRFKMRSRHSISP